MNGYETVPYDTFEQKDRGLTERIEIPDEYIELCEQWHSGQYSMFYAISSTGALKLGSINPGGSEPLSHKDWMLSLISDLRSEISFVICQIRGAKGDRMGPDSFDLEDSDYYGFLDFMGYIVEKQGQLEAVQEEKLEFETV
jgi:hypothetical protein